MGYRCAVSKGHMHPQEDDALVASEIVEKFWAEVPGIYIRIDEL